VTGGDLTLEQVTDVANGEYVDLAPTEILAIKNAYEAYGQLYFHHYITRKVIDPFSVQHMQYIHHVFMKGLSKQAGLFRSDAPAEKTRRSVGDLADWARESREGLLIKACVVHYELMSIMPFGEGSEYVARLWQMCLVHQEKGDFVHVYVPVMRVLSQRRQEYHDILAIADKAAGRTRFVEFMLQVILDAMAEYERDSSL